MFVCLCGVRGHVSVFVCLSVSNGTISLCLYVSERVYLLAYLYLCAFSYVVFCATPSYHLKTLHYF